MMTTTAIILLMMRRIVMVLMVDVLFGLAVPYMTHKMMMMTVMTTRMAMM